MLVLTRRVNESIRINDDIIVSIVDIRGDKVRLGIEYPHHMSVHRTEVYDAIKRTDPSSMPAASRRFVAASAARHKLGLAGLCQQFANAQSPAPGQDPDQSATEILDAFKLAVLDELNALKLEAQGR